jgi:hypothetical protein
MGGGRPLANSRSRSSGRDDGADTSRNLGVEVIKPNRRAERRKGEESVEAEVAKYCAESQKHTRSSEVRR